MATILSQTIPVHHNPSYLFNTHFNIVLPYKTRVFTERDQWHLFEMEPSFKFVVSSQLKKRAKSRENFASHIIINTYILTCMSKMKIPCHKQCQIWGDNRVWNWSYTRNIWIDRTKSENNLIQQALHVSCYKCWVKRSAHINNFNCILFVFSFALLYLHYCLLQHILSWMRIKQLFIQFRAFCFVFPKIGWRAAL
jgi:hypothetical protein